VADHVLHVIGGRDNDNSDSDLLSVLNVEQPVCPHLSLSDHLPVLLDTHSYACKGC
jgi:hypothetical protein